MKKILLTGGHAATTAISVIEEVLRRFGQDGVKINWIGPRFPTEGKNVSGLEVKVFPEMGIKTYLLNAGRIQRKFTRHTLISLIKIPFGFIQALFFILRIKPDITLSFGGFAAFPVVFVSWILRIPVLIHEQTAGIGLANRLSLCFAKEILLSRENSQKHIKNKKYTYQVVGNPVMTQITEVEVKKTIGNPPVVFVMGGSRGSERINDVLFNCLNLLLSKYKIIHISGESDFEKFQTIKNPNYQVFSYVSPLEIDNLYRIADIVVSRSGANTVSELMVVKRPAVLIPIPWSHLNEQWENAKLAENFGLARTLNEEDLSRENFVNEIDLVVKNWKQTIDKIEFKSSSDIGASSKIVDTLQKYLK